MLSKAIRARLIQPLAWILGIVAVLALVGGIALLMAPEPRHSGGRAPGRKDAPEIRKLEIDTHWLTRFGQWLPLAVVILGAGLTYHFNQRLAWRQAAAETKAQQYALVLDPCR